MICKSTHTHSLFVSLTLTVSLWRTRSHFSSLFFPPSLFSSFFNKYTYKPFLNGERVLIVTKCKMRISWYLLIENTFFLDVLKSLVCIYSKTHPLTRSQPAGVALPFCGLWSAAFQCTTLLSLNCPSVRAVSPTYVFAPKTSMACRRIFQEKDLYLESVLKDSCSDIFPCMSVWSFNGSLKTWVIAQTYINIFINTSTNT